MRVRCLHCHDPIELDDAAGLDSISCPTCGESFKLVGDDTLPLPAERAESPRVAPRTLGRFELLQQLGKGGYGTVWLARDPELDRLVAVKVPRTSFLSPEETEQFLREARAAAQLHHPNIVTVHEIGRDGDTVFIVSDYVRGQTLAQRLLAQRMSAREAAQMTVKIAEALDHAHEHGVIHRDLKPGNIMVAQPLPAAPSDGTDAPARTVASGAPEPYIMDFGLARREAGEMTMTVEGQVLGTPHYMSPEQARGESHQADRRSDIYSLGVILYAMLTGELPFRGNVSMLVHQILNDEPASLRRLDNHVPRDLETICLKCLHKNPERRYQRASELAGDLRRWLSHEPIHARPVGRLERTWRWSRRKPWAAAALLALFGLLVTVSLSLLVYHKLYLRAQIALRQSYLDAARRLLDAYQPEPHHRSKAAALLVEAAKIKPDLESRNLYLRSLNTAELVPGRKFDLPGWGWGDVATYVKNSETVLTISPKQKVISEMHLTGDAQPRLIDLPGGFTSPTSISSDGRFLAAVDADGSAASLWDLKSKQRLGPLLGADGRPLIPACLAFNEECDQLALAVQRSGEFLVTIYNVPSLEPTRTEWTLQASNIDCLRFAPGNKFLAASYTSSARQEQARHRVQLWHPKERSEIATLRFDGGGEQGLKPHRIDVTRDGRLLAVATPDGNAKVWRVDDLLADPSARVAASFSHHEGEALAARFSPCARWLAVTGLSAGQSELVVWDLHNGGLAACARIEGAAPLNLHWSNAGSELLCDSGQAVQLWQMARPFARDLPTQQQPLTPIAHQGAALQFSPNEHWLACGTQGLITLVHLHGMETHYLHVAEPGSRIVALAFKPDGSALWSAVDSGHAQQAWHLPSLQPWNLTGPDARRLVAIAFNSKGVAVAAGLEDARTLKVWELQPRRELHHVDVGDLAVRFGTTLSSRLRPRDVRLTSDGKTLALITQRRSGMNLTVHTNGVKQPLCSVSLDHYQACLDLAQNGKLVAIGQENRVLIYECATGALLCEFEAYRSMVDDLMFSRSGQMLVSISTSENIVRLWNSLNGEMLASLDTGERQPLQVALSPAAAWLAIVDSAGYIQLWNLQQVRRSLADAGLDWSHHIVP